MRWITLSGRAHARRCRAGARLSVSEPRAKKGPVLVAAVRCRCRSCKRRRRNLRDDLSASTFDKSKQGESKRASHYRCRASARPSACGSHQLCPVVTQQLDAPIQRDRPADSEVSAFINLNHYVSETLCYLVGRDAPTS